MQRKGVGVRAPYGVNRVGNVRDSCGTDSDIPNNIIILAASLQCASADTYSPQGDTLRTEGDA